MYLDFYGLHAHPFQLTPDPAFFFGANGHTRAKSYLMFGLSQGEGFVVVTGDVGAGKTTLLSHMLRSLSDRSIRVARLSTTQLSADDTARVVARAFGLAEPAHPSKGAWLEAIEVFLTQVRAAGERCVLIVDEVQNMGFAALEELRMLGNLGIDDGHSALQTILVGQPQFRNTLAGPSLDQLRQRIVASCHLGPIEPEEVGHYMRYRLTQAGWRGDPSFEEAVFPAVYRHSGGLPRRINILCSRLLLAGFLQERHDLRAQDVEEVAAELEAEAGEVIGVAGETRAGARLDGRFIDAGSLADLEERVLGIEERLRKVDLVVRRGLLNFSDFVSELNAVWKGRP
ncbi:XrtA/PEP-CTERM system-associated ATPase [Rhodospirillum rubrum]|uniref:ATPase n=1 Tax=Rhodospirillum rubrum (strain ATCC 11170 / ATH 1.1.1 / DSM 467 / LMG 4362 / NCIMB 8255 / S1) TaxID=269796 RepID=Q2RPN5_RHORT|nr:XrtA/PEP-CTERM system-associated ATPase [Rhodospirillum rubrum]ABC23910.1 ATPase [Rhodospirillum rubrum ATCC 11170]AEO49654.1 ATPase [Rhodospirillum rubrum F11]MBK5955586.1 ATPase [Rhodospirillum rubrum]QXG79854.1 XrtA-associated ATPase [Rhodospirillum rubrum]